MKDYKNSDCYTILIERFHTYEINQKGKWNPYYILEIKTHVYTKDEASYNRVISPFELKCFDIKNNNINYIIINCKGGKMKNYHGRLIETPPTVQKHFLVQLHKLESL